MDCSEVSETLVRLECSWISVYLTGAEMTKIEVRVHLNFPHNQMETHSPVKLQYTHGVEIKVCIHTEKILTSGLP